MKSVSQAGLKERKNFTFTWDRLNGAPNQTQLFTNTRKLKRSDTFKLIVT